ncbi:MAG: hypothetical protein Q9195_009367 [Heterodermia aff. obscurata]
MADATNPDTTRVVDSDKGMLPPGTLAPLPTGTILTISSVDNSYHQHKIPFRPADLELLTQKYGSKYPLVALYTDTFPAEGHRALDVRKIAKKRVNYLLPSTAKDFSNDPRFYDYWSKLTPFSLVEYERVVQLDSDMLLLQNMDELMHLELDPPVATKPHYPKNWIPENCAYTSQHHDPETAQTQGAAPTTGLGMPNGGLQVVNPSQMLYDKILHSLTSTSKVENYEFADQSLLSDVFWGRWVALPYIYNALKTLRSEDVHAPIWRDEKVKNIHYILSPKPWDEKLGEEGNETHTWWLRANEERLAAERESGIDDGF